MTTGQRMRERRKQMGITVAEVASPRLSPATVYRYENGEILIRCREIGSHQ